MCGTRGPGRGGGGRGASALGHARRRTSSRCRPQRGRGRSSSPPPCSRPWWEEGGWSEWGRFLCSSHERIVEAPKQPDRTRELARNGSPRELVAPSGQRRRRVICSYMRSEKRAQGVVSKGARRWTGVGRGWGVHMKPRSSSSARPVAKVMEPKSSPPKLSSSKFMLLRASRLAAAAGSGAGSGSAEGVVRVGNKEGAEENERAGWGGGRAAGAGPPRPRAAPAGGAPARPAAAGGA